MTGHKQCPIWPSRILVLVERLTATQAISFEQPLAQFTGTGAVSLRILSDSDLKRLPFDWHLQDFKADVLVLSRYGSSVAPQYIRLAKQSGIPVVCHLDDDLLSVPASLGEKKMSMHNDPARIQAFRDTLDEVDLTYASTPFLGETLRAYGGKAPVIAGEIYCSIDPALVQPPCEATGPVIGYMGSGGHGADLQLVVPVIERLMTEIPSLRFETFGTIAMPSALLRFESRVGHIAPAASYPAFLRKLSSLGWWVGLGPLLDNRFNRCKANTKWVEYSLAGIAMVAVDLPVYRRADHDDLMLFAGSDEEWYDRIKTLLCDRSVRRAVVAAAQKKLRVDYSHDKLGRQLIEVLNQSRK